MKAAALALAIGLAAACGDASTRSGASASAPTCGGSKCDDPQDNDESDDDAAESCWSSGSFATTERIDSGICERLRDLDGGVGTFVDPASTGSWTIFAPGNNPSGAPGCWARIDNPGDAADVCVDGNPDVLACDCRPGAPNCWVQFDVETLLPGVADVVRADAPHDDACYLLGVAQRRCRGELPSAPAAPPPDAICDTPSSCTPGLEVDCVAFEPPWPTSVEAPQSRCTGVTVNGLGYANRVPRPVFEACDVGPGATALARCDALGQIHSAMDPGLCAILQDCVEPALACLQVSDDPAVYAFPSGTQQVGIDLVCSGEVDVGNHRLGVCRALDINVAANGGNLEPSGAADPEANLAPAFVAVMEACGLRWGGRWSGTVEVPEVGCDPMHFDFLDCGAPPDPPTGLCDPSGS